MHAASASFERKQNIPTKAMRKSRIQLCADKDSVVVLSGFDGWADWLFQKVNNALIEFIAHYLIKRTGSDLAPGTL